MIDVKNDNEFLILSRYSINCSDISYIDFEHTNVPGHPLWNIEIVLKQGDRIVIDNRNECNYVYFEFYGENVI